MFYTILKPQYWMLDRQIRHMNRLTLTLMVVVPVLLGQWLFNQIPADALAGLRDENTLGMILLFGILGITILMLLDMQHMLYQLFESPDIDILLINPVSMSVIFLLKLLQCGRTVLFGGLFFIGMVVYGSLQVGIVISNLMLMTANIVLMLTMIPVLLISLVMLLCWVIPPRRLRSVMLVIFATLPLALLFIQANLSTVLSSSTSTTQTSFEFVSTSWGMLLGLGVINIFLMLGAFWIFNQTFQEGRARYQTTYKVHQSTSPPSSRWLLKEWHILRRDTRRSLQFLQPIAISILLLLPIVQGTAINEGLRLISFWFLFLFSAQLIVTTSFITSDSLISEGRNIALLRTQPVSLTRLLWNKFLLIWGLQNLIWSLCLLIIALLYQLAIWQWLWLMLFILVGSAITTLSALAIAALTGDFNASRIPRLVSIAATIFHIVWVVSLGIVALYGLHWLTPQHDIWLVLETLNIQIPMWLQVGSISLIFLITFGTIFLYYRSLQRLNTWQIML